MDLHHEHPPTTLPGVRCRRESSPRRYSSAPFSLFRHHAPAHCYANVHQADPKREQTDQAGGQQCKRSGKAKPQAARHSQTSLTGRVPSGSCMPGLVDSVFIQGRVEFFARVKALVVKAGDVVVLAWLSRKVKAARREPTPCTGSTSVAEVEPSSAKTSAKTSATALPAHHTEQDLGIDTA